MGRQIWPRIYLYIKISYAQALFLGHLSQYAIPVCQHIFVFTCRLALQDQKISFFTINLSFGAALKQGEAPLYPRAEDLLRV